MNGDSKGLILGLNYSGMHDSAVALVAPSGSVLFACALERLTRVKQDGRPPGPLLDSLPWDRIETIAVSTNEWPWSPVKPESLLHPTPLATPRVDFLEHQKPFYDYLETLPRPKRFVCHHASHAASAFWQSGVDQAICLTYDGGMCNSPWFGGLYQASRSEGITPLDRFASSHYAKITSLYSIVTALLGFTPNKHEGKITGLAAYGRPSARACELLNELFTADYLKMERMVEWFHAYSSAQPAVLAVNPQRRSELLARFKGLEREDIAATLQKMAEEHVIEILRRARDLAWRSDAICLSGGLFANVKINLRVKEFGFREIFISPAMTDDGTALGAALAVASERDNFVPEPARHMFLGPGYDAGEIERSLRQFGLRFRKRNQPAQHLARELSKGAVVGIFQGRSEFGPRALGNRSILSQAIKPEINKDLNQRLRRTEFMPFAPVTRWEDAAECYAGLDEAGHAAEFMTITCECTERMRRQSPAVVHADGTARPQLVRRDQHPLIHEVLTAYKRLTGIASLINTSFNVHEQPIVCSPADAIRGFLEAGVDLLYMEGGFVVSLEGNLAAALDCMRQNLSAPSEKERQLAAENVLLWERSETLRERLNAQTESCKKLDQTAKERLEALEKTEAAREEIEKQAGLRETQLHELTAIIASRDARIAGLERTASERLDALQRTDSARQEIEKQAALREAQLHELTAIIASRDASLAGLEQMASERLDALQKTDFARQEIEKQAALRETQLHELTAVIALRDERLAELERMAKIKD